MHVSQYPSGDKNQSCKELGKRSSGEGTASIAAMRQSLGFPRTWKHSADGCSLTNRQRVTQAKTAPEQAPELGKDFILQHPVKPLKGVRQGSGLA